MQNDNIDPLKAWYWKYRLKWQMLVFGSAAGASRVGE
jgi:hypothetical protein